MDQNASDVIASANSFNEAPQGQYVLVDLSVVDNGADEGDPWTDLTQDYTGTDARDHSSSSCAAVAQPTTRSASTSRPRRSRAVTSP